MRFARSALGAGCACRKFKDWRRQLKNLQRRASQIVYRGGPNQEARVKKAVREYFTVGREISAKVRQSLLELCSMATCATRWERLAYSPRCSTSIWTWSHAGC